MKAVTSALMIDIPILYMIIVDTPAKYTRRYNSDAGSTFSGVCIRRSKTGIKISPTIVERADAISPNKKFV